MYKLVVLFSVLALAAAKPGYVPLTYSTYGVGVVPAVSSVSQYSSDVVHGSAFVYGSPYAYRSVVPAVTTLTQAPHTPAVVLDPINGVPLDTPEVVAARVAHYQAKALTGVHHLAKRSVAPVAYSSVVSPAYSPLTYTTPYVSTYGAPVVSAYSYPSYPSYTSHPSYSTYSVVPQAFPVPLIKK